MSSFAKAKIHRFNEETTCAPPPGRYDPKLDTKIKGAVLPVSKRFPHQKCSSSSLDSIEGPVNPSHATFRTPQLTRKKLIKLTSTEKLNLTKEFNSDSGSSSSASKSQFQLASGIQRQITRTAYKRLENELSECGQKLLERNLEIKKLEEDLEKVKQNESELMIKLEEKNNLIKSRSKELLELKNNFDVFNEKLTQERQENKKLLDTLSEEISALQAEKEDIEGILAEKHSVIVAINDKYVDLERELQSLQEENRKYSEEIIRLKESNLEIVDKIVTESELKIEYLEDSLNTKVKNLELEFSDARQKVEIDFQTQVNFFSHEFDLKTEEMHNKMTKCFSSIKDLESFVNEKEKEFLKDIQEADERCKYMYRELCKVEEQRDELVEADLEKKLAIVELTDKANTFEEELEHCRTKCKKYEITLNSMQETIKALSERLVESEIEVERLSKVESVLESQKMVLEEKSQLLLSDITALRESMDRMEKDIIYDVTALKEHLVTKAEHFKAEASRQVGILNDKINEKQSTIDVLLSDNSYYKNECDIKDKFIRDMEKKADSLALEIVQMKSELQSLQQTIEEKDKIEKTQLQTIKELQSNLALEQERCHTLETTKDRCQTEISKLEHDNIDKAEFILELSMTIDSLKEAIKDNETKMSCLEAEKDSLYLQLADTLSKNSDLETRLENKNMVINNLTNRLTIAETNCKENLAQIDKLHTTINKHNEELKLNTNIAIELTEADEKIAELQEKLALKEEEMENLRKSLQEDKKLLRFELEKSELQVQYEKKEKENAEQELAQLLGHQNIRQKIRHVNQLKQQHMELKQANINLEIEVKMLRKKLAESKENAPQNDTPKSLMKKNVSTKPLSPSVLKDRNH
uniref:Hyaluronan-mediated motility receptor C-terminal domain-containing protein n=1 Tax=Homalodisca liturata TaxID=320908 RepID=A0A1B6I3T4_9HEMI